MICICVYSHSEGAWGARGRASRGAGGNPLPRSTPQELLKAPTYSVKVLIELTPPLRAPIGLNVVKDSTVLQVTR